MCATGAVHTDIFRSIRYLPTPVPSRNQNGRGLWLQSAAAMPDPTTRSSKPVTRPVRQNSYIPHNRITRAAKRRPWRCMPYSLQASMSSGCIVVRQVVILDCGVSNPEAVTTRWRSAQTTTGWRRHLQISSLTWPFGTGQNLSPPAPMTPPFPVTNQSSNRSKSVRQLR